MAEAGPGMDMIAAARLELVPLTMADAAGKFVWLSEPAFHEYPRVPSSTPMPARRRPKRRCVSRGLPLARHGAMDPHVRRG